MNNVLTASRINTALSCWRKHFWNAEIGLHRNEETSPALRIGSAWARAMESRWKGLSYDSALADAIPEGCMLFDQFTAGMISALLAAYYEIYGANETQGGIVPEVQFSSELGDGWTTQGKIDGLGELNGRTVIIESKTTSDSIAPGSDFWLRTTFNVQVYQYIVEARKLGLDVATTYYDVAKKPMVRPLEFVPVLDENDQKIVTDIEIPAFEIWKHGKPGKEETLKKRHDAIVTKHRIFTTRGKNKGQPKQSADKKKGEFMMGGPETPDQFCDRVYKDVLSRSDFYFCRREIPVIEQQVVDFIRQRQVIRDTIRFYRDCEDVNQFDEFTVIRDPSAWPRNVSSDTCDYCQFKSFCLTGQSIDPEHPPMGFSVQEFNPELAK